MAFVVLRRRLRLLAVVLLYASLAAIAAATVLAEFGEAWWIADLFAHFRYHYALGALLLVAVALALGRRGMGLAAAALVIPQLWAVAAPPRTPEERPPAAADTFRAMSVNVLYSNRRFDDVVGAVERERPSESRGRLQRYVRGFPIDHILTSRHFAVAGARVLENVGSDHYPVLADLYFRR